MAANEGAARAELEVLLRERLSEAERGEFDERNFEEIADEAVRRARHGFSG